ncbi:hypothetical protein ABZ756_13625 [Mammaliicoccus sciuri]
MITVKDIFDYAVELDLSRLAHSVYWAISNKLVQPNDGSEKLKMLQYEDEVINQLIESNMLGIGRIKLFVIETQRKDWFAFHLAENALDANRLHSNLFRDQGGRITRADRLMIPIMAFAETGKEKNLYELKKSIVQYPAYVGHAKANEHVLYRMGV